MNNRDQLIQIFEATNESKADKNEYYKGNSTGEIANFLSVIIKEKVFKLKFKEIVITVSGFAIVFISLIQKLVVWKPMYATSISLIPLMGLIALILGLKKEKINKQNNTN